MAWAIKGKLEGPLLDLKVKSTLPGYDSSWLFKSLSLLLTLAGTDSALCTAENSFPLSLFLHSHGTARWLVLPTALLS